MIPRLQIARSRTPCALALSSPHRLRIPLAKAIIHQSPSGETKITIAESVRDYDVYILNTVRISPSPRTLPVSQK